CVAAKRDLGLAQRVPFHPFSLDQVPPAPKALRAGRGLLPVAQQIIAVIGEPRRRSAHGPFGLRRKQKATPLLIRTPRPEIGAGTSRTMKQKFHPPGVSRRGGFCVLRLESPFAT